MIKGAVPTISEAIERFFEDAEARGLAEATSGKLNLLLRKRLLPWCRSKGYLSLKQLTVDELTQFRATWPDSPISKYKKQERLKSFLHFCVAGDLVRTNPVLGIKPVKVPPSPTLAFDEEQMTAILDACDRYPIMASTTTEIGSASRRSPSLCAIPACGSARPSRVRVIDLWARNFFCTKPKQARQSIALFHRSSSTR